MPNFDPKLIVDAGAYVGYSTSFFARKYPNAYIISVEPESSNFKLLVRNTQFCLNVMPIQAALWATRELLEIKNPTDDKWAIRVREANSTNSHTIQAVTVPDIFSIARSEYIDLLKMDIEGAEKIFSNLIMKSG